MPGKRLRRKKAAPNKARRGFSQEQIQAAVAARDRAASGNPALVRHAFLGGSPVQIGALKIGPLTIGGCWLLEEIGNSLAYRPEGTAIGRGRFYRDVADAVCILAMPRSACEELWKGRAAFERRAFALACEISFADFRRICECIASCLAEAMETVPPEAAGEANGFGGLPKPNPGLGWGLVLLDYLLSAYSGNPDFWVWEYPLRRAFPLFAAGQARQGVKPGGPTYAEQEILAAIRKAAPKE